MSKVRIIALTLILLHPTKHNPINLLKDVALETQHINIGSKISLKVLKRAVQTVRNASLELQEDPMLQLQMNHPEPDLTGWEYMIHKPQHVKKFQSFDDITNRANYIIEHLDSICSTRHKRWDLLGELLNEATGVPTRQMHEHLKQQLNHIKEENTIIIQHGLEMNKTLTTTNTLTNRNLNKIKSLATTVDNNLHKIERMERNQVATFNMINFLSNSNSILDLAEHQIGRIEHVMALGINHQTSKFAISPKAIQLALNHHMTPPLFPVFNTTSQYYSQKFTQISCSQHELHVTMKIPLIDMNDLRTLTLINTLDRQNSKKNISPFTFKLLNPTNSFHSYFTMSDLEKCTETEKFFLCNKRMVEISNDKSGEIIIYDISPQRIMIDAKGEAFTICGKTSTHFKLEYPIIALLPQECQITHKYFKVHTTHLLDQDLYESKHVNLTTKFNITRFNPEDYSPEHKKMNNLINSLDELQSNNLDIIKNLTILKSFQENNQKQYQIFKEQHEDHYKQGKRGIIISISVSSATGGIILLLGIITISYIFKFKKFQIYAKERIDDKS